MIMLIASFSGKVYSLRAKENRNKLKENKNTVSQYVNDNLLHFTFDYI